MIRQEDIQLISKKETAESALQTNPSSTSRMIRQNYPSRSIQTHHPELPIQITPTITITQNSQPRMTAKNRTT